MEFELVARTTEPNEDRRTFSFSLGQPRSSPEWTGRMVETLRVVVTDSKRARGRRGDGGGVGGLANNRPRRNRPFRQGSGGL